MTDKYLHQVATDHSLDIAARIIDVLSSELPDVMDSKDHRAIAATALCMSAYILDDRAGLCGDKRYTGLSGVLALLMAKWARETSA